MIGLLSNLRKINSVRFEKIYDVFIEREKIKEELKSKKDKESKKLKKLKSKKN